MIESLVNTRTIMIVGSVEKVCMKHDTDIDLYFQNVHHPPGDLG